MKRNWAVYLVLVGSVVLNLIFIAGKESRVSIKPAEVSDGVLPTVVDQRINEKLDGFTFELDSVSRSGKNDGFLYAKFNTLPYPIFSNQNSIRFIPNLSYEEKWIDNRTLRIKPLENYNIGTQYKAIIGNDIPGIRTVKMSTFTASTAVMQKFTGTRFADGSITLDMALNATINVNKLKDGVDIVAVDGRLLSYDLLKVTPKAKSGKESGNQSYQFVINDSRGVNKIIFKCTGGYESILGLDGYSISFSEVKTSDLPFVKHTVQAEEMSLVKLAEINAVSVSVVNCLNPTLVAQKLPLGTVVKIPKHGVLNTALYGNDPLKITRIYFGSNAGKPSLLVKANRPLALENILKLITITPTVEQLSVSTNTKGQLTINGEFKPEMLYTVTLKKGILSLNNKALKENYVEEVKSGKIRTVLQFTTSGLFLPIDRCTSLPVTVCNVPKVKVKISRVFVNNYLNFYRDRNSYSSTGENAVLVTDAVWLPGVKRNQNEVVKFPLKDYLKGKTKGFYKVELCNPRYSYYRRNRTSRLVLISDIAMHATVTKSDLSVWCKSLSTGKALAGCKVEAISRQNQVLASAVADSNGMLRMAIPETSEVIMLLATLNDDVSILGMDYANQHDLTSFSTSGKPHKAQAYDAFVYTERDIYRPGETLYISAIVKDKKLKAAPELPLTVTLYDDRHNKLLSRTGKLDEMGLFHASFVLPASTRLGYYQAKVSLLGETQSWGSCSFKVAYFEPDRVKAKSSCNQEVYENSDELNLNVQADYYFGSPVVDCGVRVALVYSDLPFNSRKYKQFTFGTGRRNNRVSYQIASGKTDQTGKYQLKHLINTTKPYTGQGYVSLASSVSEKGGRAVTSFKKVRVDFRAFHLGLRHNSDNSIDWLTVNSDDEQVKAPQGLIYELSRVDWEYVMMKNSQEQMVWQWEKQKIPVKLGRLFEKGNDLQQGQLRFNSLDSGHYQLVVRDSKGQDTAKLNFNYSSGEEALVQSHLSYLKVEADRELYAEKAEAGVVVDFPADGDVCLVLLNRKIVETQVHSVKKGANRFSFNLPDCKAGSVYVAVTFVRKNVKKSRLPRRLFGLCQLNLDQSRYNIPVELVAEDEYESGAEVEVTVNMADGSEHTVTQVQLFAVDQGILALTRYQTPNPFNYFYGKKALNADFYDLYDQLFPDIDGQVSKIGGGSSGTSVAERKLTPESSILVKTFQTVIGKQGVFKLKLPDFSGELRLMAVAVRKEKVGGVDHKLILRKDTTLELTAPKVVSIGDQFELSVEAFNHRIEAGDAEITLKVVGPIAVNGPATQKFFVKKGTNYLSLFKLVTTEEPGLVKLHVRLQMGDHVLEKAIELVVRAPQGKIRLVESTIIRPGQEHTVSLSSDWLKGSDQHTVTISNNKVAEIQPAIDSLLQYPYGCLEQTTSAAFPALFARELAQKKSDKNIQTQEKRQVVAALKRFQLMQLVDGGYSMWPGGRSRWLTGSIYSIHFKIEAKKKGFELNKSSFTKDLTFLKKIVYQRFYSNQPVADQAYALYLLAMAGKPESQLAMGLMNDKSNSMFVRAMAAGALLKAGKSTLAMKFLSQVSVSGLLKREKGWELDLNTRKLALVLPILLEAYPTPEIPEKVFSKLRLLKTKRGVCDWGSTQDNAMAVYAYAKWAEIYGGDASSTATVSYGGKVETFKGTKVIAFSSDSALKRNQVKIKAGGPGPIYVNYEAIGVTTNPVRDEFNGIKVSRLFLDQFGKEMTAFKKGQLVTVLLEFESDSYYPNVVVKDMLPGGFTIEDGALATRANMVDKWRHLSRNYHEKWANTFLLFANLNSGASSYSYTARVTGSGTFIIPAVTAESMYELDIYGKLQSKGEITIK